MIIKFSRNVVYFLCIWALTTIQLYITFFSDRLAKMPVGVTDRDIVQHIGVKRDEDNNTTYLLYKNATHDKYPAGKDGNIRWAL